MTDEFQVEGRSQVALFTLKLHRGDGMTLVAMNWKDGKPPEDFVGFAIEYKEPGGDRFFALKNRLGFLAADGKARADQLSTRLSPIQKFRWVHFPRNADLEGDFVYRVTPVFMNSADELSYGEAQEAAIGLRRETYPGLINVAFTRGFVSSQAFVDRYASAGPISTLLPAKAAAGLTFTPTHPKTEEALAWMGFEARTAIFETLDQALADEGARVCAVAYDLNEPGVLSRLEKLGNRLRIIIDDSDAHGADGSAENRAAERLAASAGYGNVKRQHVAKLQHNKFIAVSGPKVRKVLCGSTNFSWRGFYVQNNHAVVLQGDDAVSLYREAFDRYWALEAKDFGGTSSARWNDLALDGIDARVAFSPHAEANAQLKKISDDIANDTTSCLFYSLAFLYQTPGPVRDAIKATTARDGIFVYGISDRAVGALDIQKPNGNVAPVYPAALGKGVSPPFSEEPSGGGGIRMHHKFIVIDFDKPSARVYLGSYNFSSPADRENGENLILIRDRRIAVSFVVEALRIFDHYHFRVNRDAAKKGRTAFALARPPRKPKERPWWDEDYSDAVKIRDRELFA